MRIFCTTDIHGCAEQLKRVLDSAGFQYDTDRLICLGDLTDRGPDSFGVVEELLKVKDLICIRGNHDAAILEFIETGNHSFGWMHGAHKTVLSYATALDPDYEKIRVAQKMSGVVIEFEPDDMPESHKQLFRNQISHYVDAENRLFVHAGYDPMVPIENQEESFLYWDRELVQTLARKLEWNEEIKSYPDVNNFKRVFVGHTPTIVFKKSSFLKKKHPTDKTYDFPDAMYMGQLVDLDTGCCFGNKLTLIDVTDDDNHIIYTANG